MVLAITPAWLGNTAAEHRRHLAHLAEGPVAAAGLKLDQGAGLHRRRVNDRRRAGTIGGDVTSNCSLVDTAMQGFCAGAAGSRLHRHHHKMLFCFRRQQTFLAQSNSGPLKRGIARKRY